MLIENATDLIAFTIPANKSATFTAGGDLIAKFDRPQPTEVTQNLTKLAPYLPLDVEFFEQVLAEDNAPAFSDDVVVN